MFTVFFIGLVVTVVAKRFCHNRFLCLKTKKRHETMLFRAFIALNVAVAKNP